MLLQLSLIILVVFSILIVVIVFSLVFAIVVNYHHCFLCPNHGHHLFYAFIIVVNHQHCFFLCL
jgi:hypothetical protein